MATQFDPGPPDQTRLRAALARLLRPLVRLLIRSGITFPALCDLLRELYVNVAEYDFALSDKPQTDSRVSLLTGIHRKEVSRLRGASAPVNAVPIALSRTSRILSRWIASPPFVDSAGQPLPLPRNAETGAPSFEALVASVTRDVRPRAILDEWIDRKLVTVDDQARVVLLEPAHIPKPGDEQQLYYFGRNLHDHMAAATSNVMGQAAPFLERAVHFDGLSQAAAQGLQIQSRELAMQALQKANLEANAVVAADPGGSWRWNFGIYIFAEEQRLPQPQPQTQALATGAAAQNEDMSE